MRACACAKTLFVEQRYAEAEKLARETFDLQLRKLGPRHRDVLDTLQRLGMAMARSNPRFRQFIMDLKRPMSPQSK
jgi:hypothetical protein